MGVILTLIGVTVVAAKGEWHVLTALEFSVGDIWLILACFIYSAYALSLRNRPKVSGIGFFSVMAIIAFFASLPLLGVEAQLGTLQWPTPRGWAILAFIAICPSLLAQLSFLRAVDLIGPGRAAVFTNLVPIFGPALAVFMLGETFHLYHGIGLVLVLGGIALSEMKRGATI
jgi:drug/metabolite transporter (DMT)-like permease